uniref:tetratricopeptide repeat protein 1 n=1 Tax=Erigeron canadensis TaxID=72917 RepID=UPI001CB8EFE0|nr:tetratricopeptide repeat protein 1 [Erigeron canadensis]
MVVLEPVLSNDEEPKKSSSTSAASVAAAADQSEATAADGYASDAYETASETEVCENDESLSDNNNNNLNDVVIEQKEEVNQGEEHVASSKENQSDEEKQLLNQKLLDQMNEAKVEGNKLFADGLYDEALFKYDYAIQLAPEMSASAEIRSICHNNRATCFFKLGKYEDSVKECTRALELNATYMKPLLRKAEAHEKLENYDDAIAVLKKILELDPSNHQARRSIIRLEPLAIEKREKMKEEMLGKLKDMGNSILGKFGMSVDNFKAVKDPNTGSYSISFQQ